MRLGARTNNLGNFERARRHITRALQIWRSSDIRGPFQEVDAQPVGSLCREALLQWHFGEIPNCRATIAEAISLAKQLKDMHGLAVALSSAGELAHYQRIAAQVQPWSSDLIELSTNHSFTHWLAIGEALRGWALSASGNTAEGLSWLKDGIEDYRASGSIVWLPYLLELKAEASYLADRTSDALQAIMEVEELVERFGGRFVSVELYRLRGIFLAATGADETQIEASFFESVRIAREQKSISLAKRVEATSAEYRRQKASGIGRHAIRLPLCN
jgi:Anaphase-promoting complex subunit 5